MTLFWIVTIAVLAILAALAIAIARQPDSFRVARSTMIDAPPETVFAILNNVRRGIDWSPFERSDPNMKRTFTGPDKGVGATLAWDGNRQCGTGSIRIVESIPHRHIALALEMSRPMKASNRVTFTLEPSPQGTRLTWAMEGPMNFAGKAFSLVCNSEKMVGGMFETGLAELKQLAEWEAPRAA
ncbi:SRPBCC family protein [Oceanibaculum nanhaiense]|uniref:SRPBCC family protein n=1 Tax=Oceanibaculum nanhaiense TaxID=1909734 RepID=UPI003D2A1E85